MCRRRRPGFRHADNLPRLPDTAAIRHLADPTPSAPCPRGDPDVRTVPDTESAAPGAEPPPTAPVEKQPALSYWDRLAPFVSFVWCAGYSPRPAHQACNRRVASSSPSGPSSRRCSSRNR